jgi:hypothetical protein
MYPACARRLFWVHMTNRTSFTGTPRGTVRAPDVGFNARWAAWVARESTAHEQLVRRKLVVRAGALALGAAILYALMW